MSDDIPRLYVKNWNRFQHYSDRNPPWIKLHRSIMSDPAFVSLPEAAQYELIRVWILAASDLGAVPFSTGLIRKMTGMRRIRYLDLLIEKGFLSKSASDLQAPCKQSARPDKSRVEKIREDKKVLIAPEAAQPAPVSPKPVSTKPTIEEVQKYMHEQGFKDSVSKGQHFFDYYEARGWIPGGSRTQMKSWKAAVRTWKKNDDQRSGNGKTAYDPSRDRLSPWN